MDMARYDDFDPQDIDPETNRPYANYSSPSLDTSFHDGEMDVDDDEPDALEACKLIAAAFPPTLHRNGGQVRALAAVRAVLEREASREDDEAALSACDAGDRLSQDLRDES